MRLDSKTDVLAHLRSLCGSNYKERDYGDEIIFEIPTKESVKQVEIVRRQADAEATRIGKPVEVDLPDYVYEEAYKAVMLGTGYWKVLMKRGSAWIELHGGDGNRDSFIDIMKQN